MSEKQQNVQLGCGTLIAIAIIVIIFSGGDRIRRVRREVEQANQRLERIEKKLDQLYAEMRRAKQPPPATSSAPATSTAPPRTTAPPSTSTSR